MRLYAILRGNKRASCPNLGLKKCMLWRQTVQIIAEIAHLANFPPESSGAETPGLRCEPPCKSFISRRIFRLRNHTGVNYLETAGFVRHMHGDPKNHQ